MRQAIRSAMCAAVLGMTLLSGCGAATEETPAESTAVGEISSQATSASEVTPLPEEMQEPTTETEPASSALPVTITASDGSLSIHAPAGWSAVTETEDNSGEIDQTFPLTAGNPTVPAYLVANRESKTETALTSFEEYVTTLTRGVTESPLFANTQVVLSAVEFPMNDSNLTARKTKFTALYANSGNPLEITYWIYAVEGSQGYYQLNFWTGTEQASSEEAIFDAIAADFSEHTEGSSE